MSATSIRDEQRRLALSDTHPTLTGLKQAELRGVWLSHLLGFCLFFTFIFKRIITFEAPFTVATDIPIRLLVIWLLLDRIGRRGKVKISGWDYVHLGFASAYALALVYADAFMVRQTGLTNYFEWAVRMFNPYLYFLVAREGTLRRGFKPYIVVNWLLATLLITCIAALLQGANILGMRAVIDSWVNQRAAELKMEGPSQPWQARGFFDHANAMAIMLVQGLALLFGAVSYRRAGPFELICFFFFILTLFATFSRTGIASIAVLSLAVMVLFLYQKRIKAALTLAIIVAGLVFAFFSVVYTFDIKRYQVFTKGAGVIKNEADRGLQGWYLRQATIERAMRIADKNPITGISVATSAINRQRVIYESAYTFEGLLLNVYVYAYVLYGIMGISFLAGIFYYTIGQLRYARTNIAFAPAAYLVGISIAITGISENTAFDQNHMLVTNIIVAFALAKIRKDEVAFTYSDNPFTPKWIQWLGFKGLGPTWKPD
jgi:hypothetical protein